MTGGFRANYVKRLREDTNIVLVETDVAAAFPFAGAALHEITVAPGNTPALRRRLGVPGEGPGRTRPSTN
jgi:hypothetical protein